MNDYRRIHLHLLKEQAPSNPDGYYEDIVSHGIIEGEFLVIHVMDYTALVNKYSKMRGAGDLVYKFANPIARGLDKVFHTNVARCQKCQRRRDALNRMIPFKGGKS